MSEAVQVFAPDGTLGTVAPEDVQQAVEAGARLATPEDIRQSQLQDKYGGGLGQAAAGVLGAASGASLGATDIAASALGFRKEVHDLYEANPSAKLAGEIVGSIAPIVASGGSGAVAKGLGTVGFGVRGAAAAGEVAGAATARLLGEGALTLGGKLAQKVPVAAVRGAIEGSIIGAGQASAEVALSENHDAVAEKVMAGALNGALFGTGAGVALGGLATVAGHGLEKATSAVQRVLGSEATENAIAKLYTKGASVASGGEIEAIEKMGIQNLSPEAREARKIAVFKGPEIREEASRAVRENLDNLVEANARITEEARGPLKRSYVEAAVTKGNEVETLAASRDLLGDARSRLYELEANAAAEGIGKNDGIRKTIKNAGRWLADAEKKIAAAESNADRFMAIDETKRAIGKWTKSLQAVEKSADPFTVKVGRTVRDEFEGMYERLRVGLEDEALWGKAAADQRAINQAWTKQIEAQGVFNQRLMVKYGKDPNNPWRDAYRVDAAKADSYVGGLTNPNNDLTHQAVRSYVDSTSALSKAIGEAYQLPASKAAEVARIGQAADAFGQTLKKAEESLTLANQVTRLRAAELASGFSTLSGLAGGLAVGGPLGALGGAIMGVITRPGQAIAQLAALERLVERTNVRISGGVKGFLTAAPQNAGRQLRQAAPALGPYRSKPEKSRPDITKQIQRYQDAARDPSVMADRISQATGKLGDNAPKVAASVNSKVASAVSFLASKAPKGSEDMNLLRPEKKKRYSDLEKETFSRYLKAVQDPLSVLDDMKANRLTRESVEALKNVYPELYGQVRTEVIKQAATQKTAVPYNKSVQLGILFDAPTDVTMTPEMLSALQQSFSQQPAQGAEKAGGKPLSRELDVGGAVATETQRLEAH